MEGLAGHCSPAPFAPSSDSAIAEASQPSPCATEPTPASQSAHGLHGSRGAGVCGPKCIQFPAHCVLPSSLPPGFHPSSSLRVPASCSSHFSFAFCNFESHEVLFQLCTALFWAQGGAWDTRLCCASVALLSPAEHLEELVPTRQPPPAVPVVCV